MPYAPITMPDPDLLLKVLLAGEFGDDAAVGTRQPDDVVSRLPYVVAHSYGGPDAIDPRFAIQATVQVDTYTSDRATSKALSERCRVALNRSWLNATRWTYDGGAGVISRVTTLHRAAPLATLADPGEYARFTARYLLTIRP